MDETRGHYTKWNKTVTESNTEWFYLYKVSNIVKLIKEENRMVVARIWQGGENRELSLNGYKVSVTQDEYIVKICCTTEYL